MDLIFSVPDFLLYFQVIAKPFNLIFLFWSSKDSEIVSLVFKFK